MRFNIITKEDLTHKIIASFKDNFDMSGLGHSLDVHLDEGVDALAVIFAVANLDGVPMVA